MAHFRLKISQLLSEKLEMVGWCIKNNPVDRDDQGILSYTTAQIAYKGFQEFVPICSSEVKQSLGKLTTSVSWMLQNSSGVLTPKLMRQMNTILARPTISPSFISKQRLLQAMYSIS